MNKRAKGKAKGLVIVYTGDGKGKTTAALGMALRAVGRGLRVLMVQFIKGSWDYGELHSARLLSPYFTVIPMGEGFTWETQDRERETKVAQEAWEFCKARIAEGGYEILIFDEIINAIDYGYLTAEEVVAALRKKPAKMHVVLTGRGAPEELIDLADLVTEMKEIKHPFHDGIIAQEGVEY